MKFVKRGVILVVFLLYISLALGELEINLIKTDYGPGELLQGKFNFSFSQPLDSSTPVIIDVDGFVYEFSLIELISKVKTPSTIEASYSSSGPTYGSVDYDFSEAGEKTLAAIDLTGVSEVRESLFNITGARYGSSDYPKLPTISIGRNNNIIWSYRGPLILNEFARLSRSYLSTLTPTTDFGVTGSSDSIYCEEVELKPSSRYKITAKVKKILTGANLIASISDSESPDTNCNPSSYHPDDDTQCCELQNIGSDFVDRSCNVNRDVVGDETAYLCIYANTGDSAKEYFKISGESEQTEVKGYYNGQKSNLYDYFIWGDYNKFETNLTGTKNVSGFETSLSDYMSYNVLVPIIIKTSGPGKIKLNNLDINVIKGGIQHINKFTQISYTPEKINPDYFSINLASLGLITTDYGDGKVLNIKIGSDTKTANFNVKELPVALIYISTPKISANQPVIFSASESFSPSNKNIVSYDWRFGDGVNATGADAAHSYANVGIYDVTLTIKDADGLEGKMTIALDVSSLAESLGNVINSTFKLVENTKKQFSESADYVKDTVGVLKLDEALNDVNTKLILVEDQYKQAQSFNGSLKESKLAETKDSLISLLDAAPRDINVERISYPANIINVNDIPSLSLLGVNKSVDEESFKYSLLAYQNEIAIEGDARLVTITYMSGKIDQFILVKKTIKPGKTIKGKIYEHIKDNVQVIELLTSGYEAVSPNSLYRWPVVDSIYYTLNSTDIEIALDLKTFVLPLSSELQVTTKPEEEGFDCGNKVCNFAEDRISCPEDCKKKYPIGFIIFLIALAAAGAWYINYYHGLFSFKTIGQDLKNLFKGKPKLFKTKEELINLVSYIKKSVSRGMTAQQIRYVLKQKGWNDKQMDEAFKQAKVKK